MRLLVFDNKDDQEGPIFLIRDDAQLMRTCHFALYERKKAGWYSRSAKAWKARMVVCLEGFPCEESVRLLFERADKKFEGVRLVEAKEVG